MKVRRQGLWAIVITAVCLGWQTEAEDLPRTTAVLNHAWEAVSQRMVGGQGASEFWDGFAPGTAVVFRSERSSRRGTYDSTTSYRIVSRKGEQLTVAVESRGIEHESTLSPRNFSDPRRLTTVDKDLGQREIVIVDTEEYTCDVFERETRWKPWCRSGEPDYFLTRIRAWHCPGVAVQHGVVKVLLTEEEVWPRRPKLVLELELAVTDLHGEMTIDGVDWAYYKVSRVVRRGEIVNSESTEWRTNMVPGGALVAIHRLRDAEGLWSTNWNWIESLTLPVYCE